MKDFHHYEPILMRRTYQEASMETVPKPYLVQPLPRNLLILTSMLIGLGFVWL